MIKINSLYNNKFSKINNIFKLILLFFIFTNINAYAQDGINNFRCEPRAQSIDVK